MMLLVLTASSWAQGGHNVPPPPPPGAKSERCIGRAIPQLEDVTAKAGITFSHASDPEKKYIPDSMSGGVILLDYDRDGWPDIYFTNAPTVAMAQRGETAHGALYHNNHDGTFTDVTAKAGLTHACMAMGGSVGDYNNDGWPDLYITCLGGNILYRNNGDGTFTDVTAQAGVANGGWSTGSAFGDYNNDGFVDLMVSDYVNFSMKNLPTFGSEAYCKYRGRDVQCGPRGLPGSQDVLYRNNGDGTFTNASTEAGVNGASEYYGLGVVWVDFNNTGHQDLYIANDSTPNYLYKNLGNGKFEDIGLESGTALSDDGSEQASMGIAVGDYNHSGRPSLHVTDFENENDDLYRNDGAWNFTEMSYPSGLAVSSLPYVKWGTAFADFANDGWLDLLTVNGHVYPQVDKLASGARYEEPMLLQMNEGNGKFCDASREAGPAIEIPRVSRGLAVGDLFNDGNMDAVVENLDGHPVILRNRGVAGRHWVSFELAGTKSNRLGLGARVKIEAGGITQTGWVLSGGSYLSQNDLRVHFGLGAAPKIETVIVYWPSGHVDVAHNLAADHFYSVLEGAGIVPFSRIRPGAGKAEAPARKAGPAPRPKR